MITSINSPTPAPIPAPTGPATVPPTAIALTTRYSRFDMFAQPIKPIQIINTKLNLRNFITIFTHKINLKIKIQNDTIVLNLSNLIFYLNE